MCILHNSAPQTELTHVSVQSSPIGWTKLRWSPAKSDLLQGQRFFLHCEHGVGIMQNYEAELDSSNRHRHATKRGSWGG